MGNTPWRKRFARLWLRLYLYPVPDPLPYTRLFRYATALVTAAVVLFCGYFIYYLTSLHLAYQTNAEDLGIMDQAIWSMLHGQVFHQTVCNIISDVNCVGPHGVMRFAIHFEPILFLVSLFYLIWADPKLLLILQTVVVALGAFPAFWIARLRLRSEPAAVVIALLYLLYPVQQQATTSDFHAVTFTASLLLFTLYFLYTRRTLWLFVFALLSMACKEEISLLVLMLGLWTVVFQHRWRTGLLLFLSGACWFVLAVYVIMPHFSPTHHPLLISRYDDLGKGPFQVMHTLLLHPGTFFNQYVLENDHMAYLHIIFLPALGLPLLAPWVLVLAVPSLILNMISSDKQMYSGLFQYNAEIVPILIFATIEALVFLGWVYQKSQVYFNSVKHKIKPLTYRTNASGRSWLSDGFVRQCLFVVLLGLALTSTIRYDYLFHGNMPFSRDFQWPVATNHTTLAQQFMAKIPPAASVSAQSALVPHLSHRTQIYLFPYAVNLADYVFLDVTSDIYPYYSSSEYIRGVKHVLLDGHYGVVAARDGYLLLKRGLPSPGLSPSSPIAVEKDADIALAQPALPDNFCSFVHVSLQKAPVPRGTFTGAGGALSLVDFTINASHSISRSSQYLTVTTYWRVATPVTSPLQVLLLANGKDGKEYLATNDFPAVYWCQTNTWKPGAIIQMSSDVFNFQDSQVPDGPTTIAVTLTPLAQPAASLLDVQARLPYSVVQAHPPVPAPTKNALFLKRLTIKK